MKYTIITLILFVVLKANADTPALAYPYKLDSYNGVIQLKSTPFDHYGGFGESYILNKISGDTLYKMDRYLWQPSKIDDTGEYIVSVESWPGTNPLNEIVAIRFYNKGVLIKEIKLSELTQDSSKFFYSVSHISWYENSEINGKEFKILSSDRGMYTFNIENGEIIKKELIEDLENGYSFKKTPIQYNDSLKYPYRIIYPQIRSSADFFDVFNEEMPFRIFNYTHPEKDSVETESFYCMIMIDTNGNGSLVRFEVEDEEAYQYLYGGNDNRQKLIGEFIKRQEFDTSIIPKGISKWVFSTWVYIEKIE